MDSSHGTLASIGSGRRTTDRKSGVQAPDEGGVSFFGGRSVLREEEAQVASGYLERGHICCWAEETGQREQTT